MGRGLSELQKRILAAAADDEGIAPWQACRIAFELLPKHKKLMKEASSARPQSEWGYLRRWHQKRLLTLSEKRNASVAASASRALARLCRRGLLEWNSGHAAPRKIRTFRYHASYSLTDKGRLT